MRLNCYPIKIKVGNLLLLQEYGSRMDPSPPSKQEIEAWLDKLGKPRAWLAEQMNVSAETVKGWLSNGRPITGSSVVLLQQLMNPNPELNPEFTLQEWEQIEELARQAGIPPREWMKRVLKRELHTTDSSAKSQALTVNTGAVTRTPANIAGSPGDFIGSNAQDKTVEAATGTGPVMSSQASSGSSKRTKK